MELSQRELQRVKGVENAVQGRVTVAEASGLLQLSTRQVKRLKARYEPGEVDWVRHGNRGRPKTWGLNMFNPEGRVGWQRRSHPRDADLRPSGFTVPALVRQVSRSQFLLYCGAQVRGLGRGCTQRGGTQFQKQVDRTFPVGEWDQVALHLALRRNIRRDCQRRLSGSGLRV
jgi:hypothetical protein